MHKLLLLRNPKEKKSHVDYSGNSGGHLSGGKSFIRGSSTNNIQLKS